MTPISSDNSRRIGNDRPAASPGVGLPVTYRCDFCRLVKSVAQGRARVRGVLWRCAQCQTAKEPTA